MNAVWKLERYKMYSLIMKNKKKIINGPYISLHNRVPRKQHFCDDVINYKMLS